MKKLLSFSHLLMGPTEPPGIRGHQSCASSRCVLLPHRDTPHHHHAGSFRDGPLHGCTEALLAGPVHGWWPQMWVCCAHLVTPIHPEEAKIKALGRELVAVLAEVVGCLLCMR